MFNQVPPMVLVLQSVKAKTGEGGVAAVSSGKVSVQAVVGEEGGHGVVQKVVLFLWTHRKAELAC